MDTIKVVIWDRVGNVMSGVRPWEEYTLRDQALLLAENPRGRQDAPSFDEIFAGCQVDLYAVEPDYPFRRIPKIY